MAQPPTRPSGPFRPTRLGRWEVIAKIAGGGMSAVYLGRDTLPGNDPARDIPSVVALKIARHEIRMDERMLEMFLEEGRLLARLVHPNIVRTLEVGGDADQDFIAMELMLGRTFAAIHDTIALREIRLNPELAAWTAARVADALHYAHELTDEAGRPLALVHRDVNPANVFATFGGEVKLFDFGLAKVTANDVAGSHQLAGKLSYLSPEQIMQMPLDRRSDVFSLGTTFWELLTGRRLFRRDSDLETVRAVQLGPIPDPRSIAPEVPAELARIAKTALERNREHRYPTCEMLARELDAFVYQRSSAGEVTARLAQLVDTLFPGEQKRQSGWLKPAISGSRQMAGSPSMPAGPLSRPAPPPRSLTPNEVTAVMPSAPVRFDSTRELPPVSSTNPDLPLNANTVADGTPIAVDAPPITEREAVPSSFHPAWPAPSSRTGPSAPPTPQRARPSGRASAVAPPPLPPHASSNDDLSRTDIQRVPPPLPVRADEQRPSFAPTPSSSPVLSPPSSIPSARPKRPIPLPSRSTKPPPLPKRATDPPDSDTKVDAPQPPPLKKR